jgi:hypothetical protein
MTRTLHLVVAGAILLVLPARLSADLRITETATAASGGRRVETVRSIYIRGERMRTELAQGEQPAVTLYDLPGGAIVDLDANRKRAQMHDIAARNAKLEKEYPRQRTSISLATTGDTRTLAGSACEEYRFTVKVPINKSGNVVLTLAGSAWIAKAAPGAGDYSTFVQSADARGLVIWYTSDNLILLAVTRARTELYRAIGATGGIPYLVEMTSGVEGTGVLAAMVRKVTAATWTATVTSVLTAPLDDDRFAIPQGWKREKK